MEALFCCSTGGCSEAALARFEELLFLPDFIEFLFEGCAVRALVLGVTALGELLLAGEIAIKDRWLIFELHRSRESNRMKALCEKECNYSANL